MSANFPSQVDSANLHPAQFSVKELTTYPAKKPGQPSLGRSFSPFSNKSTASLVSDDSFSTSKTSPPSTPGYQQISSQPSARSSTTTISQDDTFSKVSTQSSSDNLSQLSTNPSSIAPSSVEEDSTTHIDKATELKNSIRALFSHPVPPFSQQRTPAEPSLQSTRSNPTPSKSPRNTGKRGHKANTSITENKPPETNRLHKKNNHPPRTPAQQNTNQAKVRVQASCQEQTIIPEKLDATNTVNKAFPTVRTIPKKRFNKGNKKSSATEAATITEPITNVTEQPHKLHKKDPDAIQGAAFSSSDTPQYTGLMAKALKRARTEKPHNVGGIKGTNNPSTAQIEAAYDYYQFCQQTGFDITEHGLARVIQDGQGKEAKAALQQALSDKTKAGEHEIMYHKKHGSIVSRSFLPDGNALVTPIDLACRSKKYPRGQIITVYPRVPTFKKNKSKSLIWDQNWKQPHSN